MVGTRAEHTAFHGRENVCLNEPEVTFAKGHTGKPTTFLISYELEEHWG